MITRVRLKNWKSHLDTELKFGDGTNILVGPMGAGKSSILESITYALFGTLPSVQTRRIKLEDIITSRPKPMDSAEVEVGFVTPEGDEYVVKRVIQRGSGTTLSELRRASGELVESPSSTRVSELIKSMLKLDYDLFERAIYSEQNHLDFFLTLQAGKRRESIDELLSIDKLEVARKSVGSLVRRIKDRADEQEQIAGRFKQDATIALLPVYECEARELEMSISEMQLRLQEVQPKIDEVKSQLQQLQETEQKLIRLEQSLRGLEGAIDTLKQRIEQVKTKLGDVVDVSLDELRQQLADRERAYREAYTNASELSLKLTASSSNVRELETRLSYLCDRLDKLSNQITKKRRSEEELQRLMPKELTTLVEKLQLEFRNTTDELASTNTRIQEIHSSIEKLVSAGPACPVCDNPLDENKKMQLLEERRKQFEAMRGRMASLESQVKKSKEELNQKIELQRRALVLEKEVEDLPSLELEHSQLAQQIKNLSGELEKERGSVENLAKEVGNSRKHVDALNEQLVNARQILQLRVDLDQLELEHKQKMAESMRVQHELWQLKRVYDESKAVEIRKSYEEHIRSYERMRAEISGKERLVVEKRKLIDSIKEKQTMMKRAEIEVKHLREVARAMTILQAALARTQTAMRREFIDGVNMAMSDLWENIYPYGDYTGIRLAIESERGGDYVLQLRDRRGNWVPVEGIASGGERTDACLTLRIAFALALAPKLSWIVLDEPTHNLDTEGIQELAKVLRERLPEIVRQVLLITHEERLEAAVSGYLYRFSRDKDIDEPTKIEQVTMPEVLAPEA